MQFEQTTDALDPETALVLLWHYTQTSQAVVPDWVYLHPAWPKPGNFGEAMASAGKLRRAARPLIDQIERKVRGD